MITVPVKSRSGNYPVLIGRDLLPKTGGILKSLGLYGKIAVVTQSKIARIFLKGIARSLEKENFRVLVHCLPDGETAKSAKELFRLYRVLLKKSFERGDTILALGGGVVGDLAGFAAASFLRGVPFVNVGTTLLAQVDSSIGGKTGINLEEGKNLAGAFYPPKIVISDMDVLKTLPDREFRSSMAEVVKYGVIRDAGLFRLLEIQGPKIMAREPGLLEKIVSASAKIKAAVVGSDEYERGGERMILNFGHTFGHGFEQASGYRKFMHGEAVAVGMVCAAGLAVRLKIFSPAEKERVERLLRGFCLPTSVAKLKLDGMNILSAIMRDKKIKAGRLRFVLPVRIGRVIINDRVPLGLVREVIEEAGAG